MRWPLVLVTLAAACGGGSDPAQPDAAVTLDASPSPDASFPACREFATAASSVPATVSGDLSGADLVAPDGCADVDAPFGVETPGPDAVNRIDGLIVGEDYVVRVDGGDDISFYVVTGCSTATGPSASECLLFRDASLGDSETGRFTATSTSAYVVVDYYQTVAPASSAFTVQAYHVDCETSAGCHGGTPACLDHRCVECEDNFQCFNSALPVCSPTTQTCVAGDDACASDDNHEPLDDGPTGATPLVVDGTGHASLSGSICAAPATERDYASFTVPTDGQTWEIRLDWADAQDLDLAVFDAHGVELGFSLWEKPERIRLTHLAAGPYFIETQVFSESPDTTASSYTLTASRESTVGCSADADCDDEFRNQLFRSHCDGGACTFIDGDGALASGVVCDSVDDCAPGLQCPAFAFVANAETRSTCAPTCNDTSDCASLGEDFVCTTYLVSDQCVQKCTDDDQCPAVVDQSPNFPPWARLHCQESSGRCLP